MKRYLCLTVLGLFLAVGAWGQNSGSIKASLVDAGTDEFLNGAVVALTNVKTPDDTKYYTSANKGGIEIKSLASGEYTMEITFMGFETIKQTVTVGATALDLGKLQMNQESQAIDDVKVEVQAIRTSQKGDTIVYNAAAFKVAADADTEGLLKKMTGITVSSDGSVEVQGETVQRILVDGKEFFGNDVSSAIRNLPAEVVDRIEVFNKLSDQAEFTGVDDGNSYKAINIVTLENKRVGVFGKVYGGYGYDKDAGNRYTVGGSVNFFNTSGGRLTLSALSNNINQRDFNSTDMFDTGGGGFSSGGGRMGGGGGGGNSGLTDINSLSLNYTNTWLNDKLDFSGNFSYNHTDNTSESVSSSTTYTQSDIMQFSNSNSWSNSKSGRYNFGARITYKISNGQQIMMRPSFSIQNSESNRRSNNLIERGLSNDNKDFTLAQSSLGNSDNNGYNIGNSLIYRAKLGSNGRNIVVNLSGNYSDRDGNSSPKQYLYYQLASYQAQTPDSTIIQKVPSKSSSYSFSAGLTYSEPLTKKSQLTVEYNASYNSSDTESRSYMLDNNTGIFNTQLDNLYSNIGNSGYLTQQVGPGFRYTGSKMNLAARLMYQSASMDGEQQYPRAYDLSKTFGNFVYSGNMRWNINSQNMLTINMSSRTSNPSISQLQDYTDLTRITNLSSGNSKLDPSYSHSLMATYTKSNTVKGRTFMLMGGGSYSTKSISNSVHLYDAANPFVIPNTDGVLLTTGQQFTQPINMDGDWTLMLNTSYGFPLNFIKSNINLNLGATFSEMPSKINGITNKMKSQFYNGGATLGSNISENIDFTLSYTGSYNISTNSSELRSSDNESINQYVSLNFRWITWQNITLTANGTYSQYKGITDNYNSETLLCNVFLGKKVFNKGLGELSVGVNDLFNQNKNFRHSVTSTSISDSTSNVLGRYWSVKLVYNLRFFKGTSGNSGNYDQINNRRGGFGGGRMGSPMMGGPGGF